jgi:cytosine/uracil/thiamine/allantoin permease
LFEDTCFTLLPAACFLIFLPSHLYFLQRGMIKVKSCKLAVCKLVRILS